MDKKILIVEDDRTLLEAMKFKLEKEGYTVEKAEDGWEALNVVERNKIDLIVSDIILPNISGLSLLSVLKEFNLNKIPVIIISSLDKASVIMSALGLGAFDFMVKPINFDELLKRINKLINKKENPQSTSTKPTTKKTKS